MMNHYGLAAYGIDTGVPAMANGPLALRTTQSGFSAPGQAVVINAGAGVQSAYGGGNVQGRVSAGLLALIVIGLGVFYVRTKGIQL